MADRDSATDQATLPELCIEISPGDFVEWRGTRAQLEGSGVLPPCVKWPIANRVMEWCVGGFVFRLSRFRPEGFKGAMKVWCALDNWRITRTLEHQGGFLDARIYRLEQELSKALWLKESAAEMQWKAFVAARDDDCFQGFMKTIASNQSTPGQGLTASAASKKGRLK